VTRRVQTLAHKTVLTEIGSAQIEVPRDCSRGDWLNGIDKIVEAPLIIKANHTVDRTDLGQVEIQGGACTSDGMASGGCAGAKSQPWPSSQPAS
jgi:hypothetical protein